VFGVLRLARWLTPVVVLGCGDARLGNSHAGVATAVSAAASCQALVEGESLVGVSPDGQAWVEGDAGMRHVSPDGVSTPVDARFTRADALVAWDASSAFVVGDNTLWSATFTGSEPLSLPPELGKPRFMCGDPRSDGGSFLVTTRGLFERRDSTWLRWALPVELLESMEIQALQGACSGEDPVMYLEAQQSLWEVRYGETASFREVADLTDMSGTGADVRVGFVALRDGQLIRFDGRGWVPIPFDEGAVTLMSVADSVLWASVGPDLYRRDRFEKWERLDTNVSLSGLSALEGYAAGGAWVVNAGELCHIAHRETLRVDGVRPYERFAEGSAVSFSVSGDPAMGSTLSARLDGQGLPVTGSAGSWTIDGENALGAGWHSLVLDVAVPEGVVRRTVKFLVEDGEVGSPSPLPGATVSWERDIRPIYEASCAACHGENRNQTFLGSYEAFSALGQAAFDLVSRGEMPPPTAADVADPLNEAQAELIETWVQEGMSP
jgi:hypothetical protein